MGFLEGERCLLIRYLYGGADIGRKHGSDNSHRTTTEARKRTVEPYILGGDA